MTSPLPMPDPDPEWKRRFEAKLADLMAARIERAAARGDTPASDTPRVEQ